jgi:rare lipoprotein A (peptidoglycan hydrolase)
MRTKHELGWPAAVILAAILAVPVLSHETPAVPDRAASVGSLDRMAPPSGAGDRPSARGRTAPEVPPVWVAPSPTRHPEPVHQLVPERTPQPTSHRTGRSVTGTATWFCGGGSPCTAGYSGGLYAAAGPSLRVGTWRGRMVTVTANGSAVRVRLIDWCACPGGRVIDLYRSSFSQLADPSVGVLKVTVEWN